ncbi:T9SS type A sorting domain-containing protein [Emticicia fontis]
MKRILLFVLLLTNYTTLAQTSKCPNPNVYISSITNDDEDIGDEYANDLSLCQGSTMTLIANTYNEGTWVAKSWRWTGPNNVNSSNSSLKLSNLSAKHAGDYTLSITFQNAREYCGTTTVTVKKKVVVKLPALDLFESNVCVGNDAQLNYIEPRDDPYGGFSYKSKIAVSWIGPNNFSSNEENPVIKNVRESGVYTATITYSRFCVGSYKATKKITVKKEAQVTTTYPYSSCIGGDAILRANPSISGVQAKYVWKGPNGFSQDGQQIKIQNIKEENTGVYKVTAYFEGGCSNIDSSFALITTQLINFSVLFETIPDFCEGMSVALPKVSLFSNENSDLSFNWTGPNNFHSNERTPVISGFTKAQSGIYHLEISLTNGCTGKINRDFYLAPIEKPVVTSKTKMYCPGSTILESLIVNSTINSTHSYSWKGPNNFSDTGPRILIENFDKSKEGTYTLTVKAEGCAETTTAKLELKVATSREVVFDVKNKLCKGSTLQLRANSVPSGANDFYQWEGPNGFKANGTDVIINNFEPNQAGNYKVIVSSNSCPTATGSTDISIISAPEFVLPNFQTICKGSTVSFYPYDEPDDFSQDAPGSYPANSEIKYEWTGPSNFKSENSSITIYNFDKSKVGIYEFKVSIKGLCASETIKRIKLVESEPTVDWVIDKLCNGKTLIDANFNNIAGRTWKEIKVFDSNKTEVGNILDAQSKGIYTAKATVKGACNFEVEKQIDISQAKPFKLTLPETTQICQNNYNYTPLTPKFSDATYSNNQEFYEFTYTQSRLYLNWKKPDNSEENTTYIYFYNPQKKDEGIYKVTGTLTGECTGTYEAQTKLIVESQKPQANFDLKQEEQTLNFENKSEGTISSFFWYFDNCEYSKNRNPEAITYNKGGNYTVSLDATNACGTSSLSKLITILKEETLLSNENLPELLTFNISPNPSAGMVEISNPNKLAVQLIIYTMEGKTIDTLEMDKSRNNIQYDFSNYTSGVYLIKCIQKNGQTRTRKIVISK